jgi:ABC-2 type transport system ATP-binding protein
MEPAIVIENASKRFGDTQALRQLQLTVDAGSVFGLLGRNGAGKTTTMRCLLGLNRVDSGQVSVLGRDPRHQARAIRGRTGVLLESDGLYARLTALQNLDYHARIHHLDAGARMARGEELLRPLDLWGRRHEIVGRWSKGMRQKLAIARALVHRPALLLLDEPFSGLDPIAAKDLRERIVALAREQGVTVLLATHDLAHAEKACDRLALIDAGTVIASGSPAELARPSLEEAFVSLVQAGRGRPS